MIDVGDNEKYYCMAVSVLFVCVAAVLCCAMMTCTGCQCAPAW